MALAARREAHAPCAPPQAHKTQKRGVKAISVKKIIGPLAVYAAAKVTGKENYFDFTVTPTIKIELAAGG